MLPAEALKHRVAVGRPTWVDAEGGSQRSRTWQVVKEVPAKIGRATRGMVVERVRGPHGVEQDADRKLLCDVGTGPGGTIEAEDLVVVTDGPDLVGEYLRVASEVYRPDGHHQRALLVLVSEEREKAKRKESDALVLEDGG